MRVYQFRHLGTEQSFMPLYDTLQIISDASN